MAKIHNKKRNIGIIYEQLVGCLASAVVEQDQKKSDQVVGILKKHFRPDTQLYKEFRLFNALIKTTVKSESLAIRILEEAKRAAQDHDGDQLRKEKTALIREISTTLDSDFYSRRVDNYRHYATIQTLLNDWRGAHKADISRVAIYEDKTVGWLTLDKAPDSLHEMKTEDVDNLTVKIMTEKFNKRYGMILNDEQRLLIREYVFSTARGNEEEYRQNLVELKNKTLSDLVGYSRQCKNRVLNEKMDRVRNSLSSISTDVIDDSTIAKFLTISKLKQELLENDNE